MNTQGKQQGIHTGISNIVIENLDTIQFQNWFSKSLKELNSFIEKTKLMINTDKKEWIKLGYKSITDEIIHQSFRFVNELLYRLWEYHIKIEIPEILPCTDGTININWKMPKFKILVNIPANNDELIDYYGKNMFNKSHSIMGKCSLHMITEVLYKWILITQKSG